MKKTALITLLLTLIISYGCQTMSPPKKPTIVLTAFGTSVHEARKVFDYIETKAEARYPNHTVRWAFTSSFIRKKLKKEGIITLSLDEVISDLREKNINDIVIQSLHVVPGQEFKEIGKVDTSGLNVAVGQALLTTDGDITRVLDAVSDKLIPDCPNVFVGHGNDHHPELNKQLVAFNHALQKKFNNAVLCTVEGMPGTDALSTVKKQAKKDGKVNFIPMMIVAGDHVMNDVMGDEPDSWKNIIKAEKTTCTKPLGYNDQILAVYFSHIDKALEALQK